MCYSVFIYSMRIELSTHSIATPVSANTASHMDAIPNRPRIITRILTASANTMFSLETIFALRAILIEIGMEVRSAS